jgi:hypothetical protein
MLGRRALLNLIGAAPIAATGVKETLAGLLASPAVATATALSGLSSVGQEPQHLNQGASKLSAILYKQVQNAQENFEDEKWIRQNARAFHFDPDISALKSVSPVNKYRKQMERDVENEALMRHVKRLMW